MYIYRNFPPAKTSIEEYNNNYLLNKKIITTDNPAIYNNITDSVQAGSED